MKILFVTVKYYPDGAGAGRSVRSLAEGLVANGHEAVVIRLSKDNTFKTETLNGVKIHSLPIRNIYTLDQKPKSQLKKLLWHIIDSFNPRAMNDVKKILIAEKPDIVNTNIISGFSAGIFFTIKKLNIPLVHTMRDYYLLCTQSAMFRNGKNVEGICTQCKPFIPLRRFAARRVDMFLANSEYVLNRHKQFDLIPDSSASHVQWNMNEDDEIAPPKTISKTKTIRFGYIGRIDNVKGLEILLEASKNLNTPNWILKVAGTGDADYIQKMQKDFPDKRIEFMGFTEPNEFYNNIDILICPSVYGEPLPRVVYEGYRAALPIIASSTGGTPEIIDEGETGFTYNAPDHATLTALMDKVASDPDLYKSLSKGATQKAKLFTTTQITNQYLARMETLLKTASADKNKRA